MWKNKNNFQAKAWGTYSVGFMVGFRTLIGEAFECMADNNASATVRRFLHASGQGINVRTDQDLLFKAGEWHRGTITFLATKF